MGFNFIRVGNLDEELICKTVKVFGHLPHRENKKNRHLEPKGEIHLAKDPHDFVMVTICLGNLNLKHVRLLNFLFGVLV